MPFQGLGAVTFNVLAKREGVVDPRAISRLTLIGGLIGLSPVGVVVGQQLARREAETETGATAGEGGDTGPAQVQVPDVSKQAYDQAAAELLNLGLTPVQNLVTSSGLPKGQVISTDPAADSLVPSGSTITVNVSQGVLVPDVANITVKEARAKLANAYLQSEIPSGAKDDDVVATQAPAAKTFVSPGDKVVLTIVKK